MGIYELECFKCFMLDFKDSKLLFFFMVSRAYKLCKHKTVESKMANFIALAFETRTTFWSRFKMNLGFMQSYGHFNDYI